MAALDFAPAPCRPSAKLGTFAAARAWWRELLRRRRQRRLFVRISRLPPHLMRDIGFAPEDVYDALEGSWDEVGISGPRRFP
jgi:uncharacterized protein YjiS (DUF1127 family)